MGTLHRGGGQINITLDYMVLKLPSAPFWNFNTMGLTHPEPVYCRQKQYPDTLEMMSSNPGSAIILSHSFTASVGEARMTLFPPLRWPRQFP